jgi:hypothetical protein
MGNHGVPAPADNQTHNSGNEHVGDFFDWGFVFRANQISRQYSKQGRRQRPHRAEQAFRIVNLSLFPNVRTKNRRSMYEARLPSLLKSPA